MGTIPKLQMLGIFVLAAAVALPPSVLAQGQGQGHGQGQGQGQEHSQGLGPPTAASESPAEKIKGNYSFRMEPVKSFSADAPGDPGGLTGAPRQDILRVGTLEADGKGNLAGHTIATTDTNNGGTWIVEFNWTGKYRVNPDGTGFFSINPVIASLVCTNMTLDPHTGTGPHPAPTAGTPAGAPVSGTGTSSCAGDPEGHEDYAFVFTTRGGKRIEFIQTDNAGSGAKIFLTGVATAHEAFGKNDD